MIRIVLLLLILLGCVGLAIIGHAATIPQTASVGTDPASLEAALTPPSVDMTGTVIISNEYTGTERTPSAALEVLRPPVIEAGTVVAYAKTTAVADKPDQAKNCKPDQGKKVKPDQHKDKKPDQCRKTVTVGSRCAIFERAA